VLAHSDSLFALYVIETEQIGKYKETFK